MLKSPRSRGPGVTLGWAAVRSVLVIDARDGIDPARVPDVDAVLIDAARASDLIRPPSPARPLLAVRVSRHLEDLAATLAARPDAVLIEDCRGLADVDAIGARLAVAEAEQGVTDGATGLVASVADGAEGLLALLTGPAFAAAGPRLRALTWDASGLAAAFGWAGGAFALARDLVPVAARAADLPALAPEGTGGGRRVADLRALRRMGYSGKLTRDPDEVAAIHAAFDRTERGRG